MEKLIITAAICGAEVTKEQNPNVPYTVEEIVREAKLAVYSHLAQAADDVKLGRVQEVDAAFDDILSELDGLEI